MADDRPTYGAVVAPESPQYTNESFSAVGASPSSQSVGEEAHAQPSGTRRLRMLGAAAATALALGGALAATGGAPAPMAAMDAHVPAAAAAVAADEAALSTAADAATEDASVRLGFSDRYTSKSGGYV